MKVLVTGATGFIGKAVAERLLRRGDEVRVMTRDASQGMPAGLESAEVVEGDITDRVAVERACDGVEVVFAIAGTFREPDLSDERYREVNVEAPRYLVEAAREKGVRRIVHCSTCGIHGSIEGPPASEQYPVRPVGIYEITKAEGESVALSRGRELGVEVVVIRPTPVYGPGDTRLLKLFKLANKRHSLIFGKGVAGYHLVYIDDLADAFVLAGDKPNVAYESFLIGGPEIPSLNDLFAALGRVLKRDKQKIWRLPATPLWLAGWLCEAVCRPLGVKPPIYRRRVEFFINNRAYDIGKAKDLLGYRPKTRLADGLAKTAIWYRAGGML